MSSPNTATTTAPSKAAVIVASAPKTSVTAPPATPANRPAAPPAHPATASPLSPTPLSTPDDPAVFTTALGPRNNVNNTGGSGISSVAPRAPVVNVQSPGTPSPVPHGARVLPVTVSATTTPSMTPSASTTTGAATTVTPVTHGPLAPTVLVPVPTASTTAATTSANTAAVSEGLAAPPSTSLLPSVMGESVIPTISAVPNAPPTQIVALRDAYADLPPLIDESPDHVVVNPFAASSSTSTAPAPAAPHSASNRLADKMELTRIAAMARDFYLASGEVVRSSTGWYRDGRGEALVYREAADAAREAQAAHAADPGVMPPPEMPLRAPLTIIATITADRCFLRPDGNFRGPNPALPFFRPFAQTTLTCALGPPPAEFPALVNDFNAGCRVFRSLLPASVSGSSGHVYQNVAGQHLRLRHALFAPKPDPADEVDDGVTLPVEFTMAGWPTYSPQASQALADIANTHVVRPLPAYDVRGDLIPPSRYLAELRGATVEATFSVTVYHISEQNQGGRSVVRTNVCLDIEYLRVLITPPQFSPKKRSAVHLTDPVSNAAGKRRRISW